MIFYAHLTTAYIEIVRYEEGELVWRGQTSIIHITKYVYGNVKIETNIMLVLDKH